jgi:hypothetical protein
MNLDYSNILDEDSIEIIKLLIEFSDKCNEWYLNLYVLAHLINNKRYFKNYRQINNYTASSVTSNLFLIEEIEII